MKKILLSICICMSCLFLFEKNVNAQSYYYDEVIEVINTYQISKATKTTTGKKTAYIKNSSGTVLWSVTVEGTFTYTGSSSKCTNSTVSASSKDSRWKITSKSSSKSGSTAKATASAKYYFNGDVIETLTKTVTLTCSPKGVLS